MGRHRASLVAALTAALLVAGCGRSRVGVDPATIRMPTAERLTNAQVVSIVASVHAALGRYGVLARDHGSSERVRTLGTRMVEEFGRLTGDLSTLARDENLAADRHWLVEDVLENAAASASSLEGLVGTEFDRAFLARQEEIALWYVALLDNTLLPSATVEGLPELLGRVRAAAASQLDAATASAGR